MFFFFFFFFQEGNTYKSMLCWSSRCSESGYWLDYEAWRGYFQEKRSPMHEEFPLLAEFRFLHRGTCHFRQWGTQWLSDRFIRLEIKSKFGNTCTHIFLGVLALMSILQGMQRGGEQEVDQVHRKSAEVQQLKRDKVRWWWRRRKINGRKRTTTSMSAITKLHTWWIHSLGTSHAFSPRWTAAPDVTQEIKKWMRRTRKQQVRRSPHLQD